MLNTNTSWAKPTMSASDAHECIQVMGRRRDECGPADVVIAARHTQQPEIMHREEDRVGSQERDPEMEACPSVSFSIRPGHSSDTSDRSHQTRP